MKNVGELKSTITGVVTLILAILVGFGILTPEGSEEAVSQAGAILEGVFGVIGGVAGLYQIFFQNDDNVK